MHKHKTAFVILKYICASVEFFGIFPKPVVYFCGSFREGNTCFAVRPYRGLTISGVAQISPDIGPVIANRAIFVANVTFIVLVVLGYGN